MIDRSLKPGFAAVALLACVVGMGCRQEDVPVRVHFPNETSFLFSDSIRMAVVEVVPEDRNACSEVLELLETGVIDGSYFDTGPTDACGFRSGGIVIEGMPEGSYAYAVVALERDDATVLLSGCSVRDVRLQEPEVRVDLRTTTQYNQVYPALPPGCTVDERCNDGCVPGMP